MSNKILSAAIVVTIVWTIGCTSPQRIRLDTPPAATLQVTRTASGTQIRCDGRVDWYTYAATKDPIGSIETQSLSARFEPFTTVHLEYIGYAPGMVTVPSDQTVYGVAYAVDEDLIAAIASDVGGTVTYLTAVGCVLSRGVLDVIASSPALRGVTLVACVYLDISVSEITSEYPAIRVIDYSANPTWNWNDDGETHPGNAQPLPWIPRCTKVD